MKFYNKDINTIAINALIDCGEITFTSIGSLRSKLLPASIKNGAITAPRQIVELHYKSSIEANTISQLISWSYSISLEEAETVYRTWLNNIKSQNSHGTLYTIDGLGTICQSANNSIVLTTDKELSQQLNPLTQEFSQEATTTPTPLQPVPKQEIKPVVVEGSSTSFWKGMTIIFILLSITAIGAALYFHTKKPKEIIREIKIEKVITDTIYITENKTSIAGKTTEESGKITNGNYHIIAGVFKSKENAQKKMIEITENGGKPILEYIAERGEYFISIISFTTQQEAQKHLNTLGLANKDTFESHWIYKF